MGKLPPGEGLPNPDIKAQERFSLEAKEITSPEQWATLPLSPQEIVDSLLEEIKKRNSRKFEIHFIDSHNEYTWQRKDTQRGGYFNVRRAFLSLFRNGLKTEDQLEKLTECDFRFSAVPAQYLSKENLVPPVAFELAPSLNPRYLKDGFPGKYILKFVVFGTDRQYKTRGKEVIGLHVISDAHKKRMAEAQAHQPKQISLEQWAEARRKNFEYIFSGGLPEQGKKS